MRIMKIIKNKLLILLRNCMEEKNIRRKNMERIYNKLVRDNILI